MLGLIFGLSALAALGVSIGFGFNREYAADEEPQHEDEATEFPRWSFSAWLGAFTHSFLALKARLFRRRARQKAVRSAVRQILGHPEDAPVRRHEPGFVNDEDAPDEEEAARESACEGGRETGRAKACGEINEVAIRASERRAPP